MGNGYHDEGGTGVSPAPEHHPICDLLEEGGVSRPWEAVVPSAGVVPSKEGCAETGEQLVGAC